MGCKMGREVRNLSLAHLWMLSVSKETHYEFIGFPWDPGSRSNDPGRVIFDNGNLKQVAKKPVQRQNEIH